jgi:hypothetical protein
MMGPTLTKGDLGLNVLTLTTSYPAISPRYLQDRVSPPRRVGPESTSESGAIRFQSLAVVPYLCGFAHLARAPVFDEFGPWFWLLTLPTQEAPGLKTECLFG